MATAAFRSSAVEPKSTSAVPTIRTRSDSMQQCNIFRFMQLFILTMRNCQKYHRSLNSRCPSQSLRRLVSKFPTYIINKENFKTIFINEKPKVDYLQSPVNVRMETFRFFSGSCPLPRYVPITNEVSTTSQKITIFIALRS